MEARKDEEEVGEEGRIVAIWYVRGGAIRNDGFGLRMRLGEEWKKVGCNVLYIHMYVHVYVLWCLHVYVQWVICVGVCVCVCVCAIGYKLLYIGVWGYICICMCMWNRLYV